MNLDNFTNGIEATWDLLPMMVLAPLSYALSNARSSSFQVLRTKHAAFECALKVKPG